MKFPNRDLKQSGYLVSNLLLLLISRLNMIFKQIQLKPHKVPDGKRLKPLSGDKLSTSLALKLNKPTIKQKY